MNEENKPLDEPSMEEILASIRRIISEDEKNDPNSDKKLEKSTVKNEEIFEANESGFGEEILVEELAREIMRPVIKEWLDNNLPQIVERVVSLEIERLSEIDKSNK